MEFNSSLCSYGGIQKADKKVGTAGYCATDDQPGSDARFARPNLLLSTTTVFVCRNTLKGPIDGEPRGNKVEFNDSISAVHFDSNLSIVLRADL